MGLIQRAVTPTSGGVVATSVAADILRYGTPCIAVLEAVENVPGLGVSGPAQGIIAAVVTVLTALLSVLRQQDVAAAKAGK